MGEFLFTKIESKGRKAGVKKAGEFSFVNIELEVSEMLKQNLLAVKYICKYETMQDIYCE